MFRVTDAMIITRPVQTQTDQLTGADTTHGLFNIDHASYLLGVYAKADVALNWTINIILPNPVTPASPVTYEWMSVLAKANVVEEAQHVLPAGAKVQVITNSVPGSDPTVQLVVGFLGNIAR